MHGIYTDLQPYLLQDTDAWALSKDQSKELMDYLASKGVKQVICTPPIRKENPENSLEFLHSRFVRLQERCNAEMKLQLSAKYRLDEAFDDIWDKGELLTIGNGKSLLVDVSPLEAMDDYWGKLDKIIKSGYVPIVMEPERTEYWENGDFVKLKDIGCQFTLNIYSLFGYNGDKALLYSRELLENGMYTYLFSGMEDPKVMYYSEQIKIEKEPALVKALGILEQNNKLLWFVNGNV